MKQRQLPPKSRPQRANADTDDPREQLRADPVFAIAQVVLLAKLMLVVLVFDPRSFDTFSLPKSVAAHSMSLLLAALLLWLVARHGRRVFFWSPAHIGAGALLAAFVVATPFALDPVLGLFGVFKRYLGLTQMLDNVVLYLAVGILFRDLRSLRLLTIVSIGTAVPVLAYAFVQRLGLDPLKFEQATTSIPISTLGNPDLAGAYVTITGITALGLAFLLWRRTSWIVIATIAVVGLACIGVLAFTGVRAGVLGAGAGWLAVVALTLRMPGYGNWRRLVAFAFGPVLAIGIAFSPIAPRLDPAFLAVDSSIQGHLEIWETAAKGIAARPVLGLGPDNFAAFYPANRAERSAFVAPGQLQNSTHDIWLYITTSAGLLGAVSFIFLVALLIALCLRAARICEPAAFALIPLFAYLGTSLVTVNEVVVDWPFWVAAGVIASASASPLLVSRRRRAYSVSVPRVPVGVAAIVSALVLIGLTEVPRLVASEAMLAEEAYSAANRGAEATLHGQQAASLDPRRAEYWSSYGTGLFTNGSTPAAAAAYLEAATLQSWQPLHWRNLAITWGAIGNRESTRAASERAVAADPYDSVSRALLSSVAYDQGDFARSAAEGEHALALTKTPTSGLYFVTISAYVQLKQLDRAESLARTAVAAFPTIPLRLQLAAILADRGEKDEAVALLDALLRDAPNNVDAQRLRAAILGQS